MAIKSYKAVLFDMDVVIFDSEQLYMRCWEALSDTYDLPGIRDVLICCIGVNAPRTREIFTETYGPDFPYDEAMAAAGKGHRAALIANTNDHAVTLETNLPGGMKAYLLDASRALAETPFDPERLTVEKDQVWLIADRSVEAPE